MIFYEQMRIAPAPRKTKRWLNDRVSEKQRAQLNRHGVHVGAFDFSWTKYKAACMLNYVWNRQFIDNLVNNVIQKDITDEQRQLTSDAKFN